MKGKLFLSVFLLIIFLGSFLRFYQLGNVPGSLDWDEVSFGYNAYSVLQTGKDEYGVSFPLVFRAFGEYKQPVYAYLDVASESLFGLNAFAVRFPSALFGSLSIVFVYLLVCELFKRYRFVKNLALLSMLFYSISPWAIQFSRIAFEANVALNLVIISVWLFLKGLSSKNKWYLIGSTIFLSLSTFTYISLKLIGPLLFIALIIYGLPLLKKQKVTFGIILLLFFMFNALWLINSSSLTRGQDVLFTNQKTQLLQSSVKQLQVAKEQHNIFGEIIYNRRVVYVEKFTQNYFSHFNPNYLIITGDSVARHHAPGMGNLYLVSFPFILLGIYFLLTRTFSVSWILFVWILIAPLASSLTADAPSSLRSLIFLPTWQIFEAAGIIFLFQLVKNKSHILLLQIVLISLYTVNFYYYMHQYYGYTNSNTDYQKAWQYGYKEADMFALSNNDKRVIFSNTFEQPYIFYLFYSHFAPIAYLKSGGSARISRSCYAINNVFFGNCKYLLRKNNYYISLGKENVDNGLKVKDIMYASKEQAVTIYKIQ